MADWTPSEAWTLGENAERLRAQLRADGWTDWREEHTRRNEDTQLHVTNIFSREHELGPLVEFVHPSYCGCLDIPIARPKWVVHRTECLKGQRHKSPCDPPEAETCVLEHKHDGTEPCRQR